MNTTNKQDETLDDAAQTHSNQYLADDISANSSIANFSFKAGARWQKEQDKVIIDKLIEALGNTLSILERERNYIGVSLYKSYAPYYNKAKELLNSLK